MAKTTLRQIEDRLRIMFTPGEHRKLVFWYDESASFEDEVEQLNIPDVTAYCTVDMNTGAVQYYKQE